MTAERRTVPGLIDGPAGYPRVGLVEEGMREGMQIESPDIPTDAKVHLLDALSRTGLRTIVAGSFVSPKWTPQMRHVDQIVERFTPADGVTYTALALNAVGRERRERHVPPLSVEGELPATYMHLCDVFAQRNTNRTQAQEIAAWEPTIAAAAAAGATRSQIGIGAAWGSNWVGGFTHEERVGALERQVEAWRAAGIEPERVFLADPMGWNQPQLVEEDLGAIRTRWPAITTIHLHLHNTRGCAIASMYAALRVLDEQVALVLDSSIGGMAGCPYCGNGRAAQLVATEDLVELLEGIGYETGVDRLELARVVRLAEQIVGHALYGHTSKAGPRPDGANLYAMDMPFIETLDQAGHFLDGPAVYRGALSPWTEPITSHQRQEH